MWRFEQPKLALGPDDWPALAEGFAELGRSALLRMPWVHQNRSDESTSAR